MYNPKFVSFIAYFVSSELPNVTRPRSNSLPDLFDCVDECNLRSITAAGRRAAPSPEQSFSSSAPAVPSPSPNPSSPDRNATAHRFHSPHPPCTHEIRPIVFKYA